MVRTLFASAFEPFTKARGLEHRSTRSIITGIDLPGNTLLNWLDRSFQFYEDSALCRDVRRKLELWLDPAVLHTVWDSTWNQWKHLAGVAIEVNATFVQSGKYRKRRGEWRLLIWETALPSRLHVTLPNDFQQRVDAALQTYHRIGRYSRALGQVHLALEHRAIEKSELQQICSQFRIPADFDIAEINWRPDYAPFFYRQLPRPLHLWESDWHAN